METGTLRSQILRAAALLLVPPLAFLVLYLPAIDNPLVWTDVDAIGHKTMLRRPGEVAQAFREPLHRVEGRAGSVPQAYYRPLQVALLSAVSHHTGGEPRHYRTFTLGVGALCIALWGFFAWSLLGSAATALFAALFVAVHPVGIETYVWIAGVSGGLCTAFVLLALGFAIAGGRGSGAVSALAFGALSLVALLAALLSKERAAIEPALLVATLASVPAARRSTGRAVALLAAHTIVVATVFLVWRPTVLGDVVVATPPIGGSAATQLLTALAQWPSSLMWLFAPWQSTTSDVVRVVATAGDPLPWLGAALLLLSALAWVALLRAGRPAAALGLAWIWIAFLPTAGLLPMLHMRAERYLFLSSFGAGLLIADLGYALAGRLPQRAARTAVVVLAAVYVAALAQRTWTRLPDWESTSALMESAVARDPAYREGHFVLALDHFEAGRYARADARAQKLLAPGSAFAGTSSYLTAVALYDLVCSSHIAQGRFGAVLELEAGFPPAQREVARTPSFRTCVGQAQAALGHAEAALVEFLAVAAELGDATPPRLSLLIARNYLRTGDTDAARHWLARVEAAGDPTLARPLRRLRGRLGVQP